MSIILFDNDQGFVGLNYGKETNTQFLKGQWLKKYTNLWNRIVTLISNDLLWEQMQHFSSMLGQKGILQFKFDIYDLSDFTDFYSIFRFHRSFRF